MNRSLIVLAIALVAAGASSAPVQAQLCNYSWGVAGYDVVDGFDSNSYGIDLAGGIYVRISVQGDGDSNLDLYVYDPWGRLVAYDTRWGDSCSVGFWTGCTGSYEVVVVNRGSYWNRFYLSAR